MQPDELSLGLETTINGQIVDAAGGGVKICWLWEHFASRLPGKARLYQNSGIRPRMLLTKS